MRSLLAAILLCLSLPSVAQEVLTLEKDAPAGKASLSQLDWLVGRWKGSGFGGDCDEMWMPAVDNSMLGIFRFAENGTVHFSEFMVIEELDETLTVKLKHFSRDLTPWEEKDTWTEFRLVKVENQTAYFNGLTYHLDGEELVILLALTSEGTRTIEEFRFNKVK